MQDTEERLLRVGAGIKVKIDNFPLMADYAPLKCSSTSISPSPNNDRVKARALVPLDRVDALLIEPF